MTTLLRVTSPYYCAGIIVNNGTGICIKAAPILRWSEGKDFGYLLRYFNKKGFTVEACG